MTSAVESKALAAEVPASLFAAVRAGGALSELFQRAAGLQREATAEQLRHDAVTATAQQLAGDARARVAAGVSQSPLQVLHACGSGCNACCFTSQVDVTPLEALAIAAHLNQNYSAPERLEICRRLVRSVERLAQQRALVQAPRAACPLLDEKGRCSVYDARPLACAGVFSLSRQACESAVASEGDAAARIPLDRPAKAWAMGVSGGLQRALVDAGLDGNLYELQSALLCALDAPRAFWRWLRGEDIFRDAHCTDAHSFPRTTQRRPTPRRPTYRNLKRAG